MAVGSEVHFNIFAMRLPKNVSHYDFQKSSVALAIFSVTPRPAPWWEGPRCVQEAQIGVLWLCAASRTSLDPTPTPKQGFRIHTPRMQKACFKEEMRLSQ